MPNLYQSDAALGIDPVPYGSFAGGVVAKRYVVAVTAAMVGTINNIIEVAPIPPGHAVIDAILDVDDLDSNGAPALVLDVGVMSGDWQENDAARTCGDELFDGITTAQAGGLVRPTLAKALRIATANTARSIGVKMAAAAATGQAGTLGLTLITAPAA